MTRIYTKKGDDGTTSLWYGGLSMLLAVIVLREQDAQAESDLPPRHEPRPPLRKVLPVIVTSSHDFSTLITR